MKDDTATKNTPESESFRGVFIAPLCGAHHLRSNLILYSA